MPMVENNKWYFIKQTKAFLRAREYAESLSSDSQGLHDLIAKVWVKFDQADNKKIKELFSSISAMTRMLKAYTKGHYRDISLKSISLVVTSLAYFLIPIDGISDFIPGLGFTDDIALLLWTLKVVSEDIDKFLEWEQAGGTENEEKPTFRRIDSV